MIRPATRNGSAWNGVMLVVFDVDGTLYDQRLLRVRMARDMLLDALQERDLRAISVLRAYRSIRERLAAEEAVDFEAALLSETAAGTGRSPEAVRAVVAEWIDRRPLRYLADCRYAGVVELFAGLRRNGILIGILSDYPAEAKLAALGLTADRIVSSTDHGVGLLKPHPRGLEVLIAAAGVQAAATVLVGDRVDRDGLAARRAGVRALIRSSRPLAGWETFSRYDDPLLTSLTAS